MATKQRDKEAPPAIVDQIRDLADDVLTCRDMRHAWGVDKPFYKVPVEGGTRGALYVERVVGCLRCGTTRHELWRVYQDWMEKLSNRYVYPEGYHLKGRQKGQHVGGMITREQFRRSIGDA